MCTGSLKERKKRLLLQVNATRSSEVFKYAIEIEAVKIIYSEYIYIIIYIYI